jgi:hypothetical protein
VSITFNNAALSEGSGTSLTFGLTVNSGSDRFLVVQTLAYSIWGNPTVTFNGSALTAVANTEVSWNSSNNAQRLMGLVAPTVTTANVVLTSGGSATALLGGAAVYDGVDQTTPTSGGAQNTGTGTAPSITVTSAAGDLVFGAVGVSPNGATIAVGADQTQRYEDESGNHCIHGADEAGAASVTWTATLGTSRTYAVSAVNLRAAAAAGQPAMRRLGGIRYGRPAGASQVALY